MRTFRFSFLTQSPGALDQTFCFQCSSTERYSIYKYRYIYFFFSRHFSSSCTESHVDKQHAAIRAEGSFKRAKMVKH